jgi:hypothetical protein
MHGHLRLTPRPSTHRSLRSRLTPLRGGAQLEHVRTMKIIRWLLIIPTMILCLYIGFFVSIYLFEFGVQVCRTDHLCSASWSSFFDKLPFVIGPFVAATLIVLLSSFIAPSHKFIIATGACTLGLFLVLNTLPLPTLGIVLFVLSGGIALWFTHRVLTLRSSGTPRKRGAP